MKKTRRVVHSDGSYEHRVIAEKILGRPLKSREVIHHVDCNPANNAHDNLVICPNQSYHMLLHLRQRALDACGNVNFRVCARCGKYDNPAAMRRHNKYGFVHAECKNAYDKKLKDSKRETVRAQARAYYKANSTKIIAQQWQRYTERMATDPVYRERMLESSRLRQRRYQARKKAQASDSA
jgi:recombinational DNA repair protein (RecF pathway)